MLTVRYNLDTQSITQSAPLWENQLSVWQHFCMIHRQQTIFYFVLMLLLYFLAQFKSIKYDWTIFC